MPFESTSKVVSNLHHSAVRTKAVPRSEDWNIGLLRKLSNDSPSRNVQPEERRRLGGRSKTFRCYVCQQRLLLRKTTDTVSSQPLAYTLLGNNLEDSRHEQLE